MAQPKVEYVPVVRVFMGYAAGEALVVVRLESDSPPDRTYTLSSAQARVLADRLLTNAAEAESGSLPRSSPQ